MRYYFAPLEGITGYIYRNAHQKYFPGVHKYFTPFIVPNQNKKLKSRELNDIFPEHNQGICIVPQIMSNKWEDFIWTTKKLEELGYQEVNLNLGCPSRTVVSKNRGSGFLSLPEELDEFLEKVCNHTRIKLSVKTRIGKDSPEEFEELLKIYNRYPLEELIIHPRIQKDFYKNVPNLEIFQMGIENSIHPVCYNGDICSVEDYQSLLKKIPVLDMVMIGRGLLSNPGLLGELKGEERVNKQIIRKFHDELYMQYQEVFYGERNVLYKMKELWGYLIFMFTDYSKYAKKIRKAERLKGYEEVIEALFEEQEILLPFEGLVV